MSARTQEEKYIIGTSNAAYKNKRGEETHVDISLSFSQGLSRFTVSPPVACRMQQEATVVCLEALSRLPDSPYLTVPHIKKINNWIWSISDWILSSGSICGHTDNWWRNSAYYSKILQGEFNTKNCDRDFEWESLWF